MVLVDTSVWIRFLAGREPYGRTLDQLLVNDQAMAHDLVEGELLMGDAGGRSELLAAYREIHRVGTIPHADVVELVRSRRLQRRRIGWVDAHLLASTLVAHCQLWTVDANLAAVAIELRIAYAAP